MARVCRQHAQPAELQGRNQGKKSQQHSPALPSPVTGAREYSLVCPVMASKAGSVRAGSVPSALPTVCEKRCMISDPRYCSNGQMSLESVRRPLLRLKTTRSQVTRQTTTVQTFKASMQRVWGIACRLT